MDVVRTGGFGTRRNRCRKIGDPDGPVPCKKHFEMVDFELVDMRDCLRPAITVAVETVQSLCTELLHQDIDEQLQSVSAPNPRVAK